jgi:UDP-glucose 4-epimerase
MSGSVQGKTYLVTGAAGMLGSFVVDRLAELDAKVIALDVASPRKGFGHSLHPAVQDVSIDILDQKALSEIVIGCSGIVHIAAMLTRMVQKDPVRGFEVNVGGTHRLLEAAANEGMDRFVLASSGATYGRAAPDGGGLRETAPLLGRSFYAASKIASELYSEAYAHERGLDFVAFRLGTMYGPRLGPNGNVASYLHAAAHDANSQVIRVPLDPNDSRDLVYIADAAECLVRGLTSERANVSLNVGTGFLTDNRELFEALLKATESGAEIEWHPEDATVQAHGRFQDMTLTREVIGYIPDTPLDLGIRKFIEWRSALPEADRPMPAY